MGGVNGTPQPDKAKSLGAKPPNGNGGNKGGSGGCLPSLFTLAALGTGWLSMLLTGSGWTS